MATIARAYEEKIPEEFRKEYLVIYNFYVEFFKKKDISFTVAHLKSKDTEDVIGCSFGYSKNKTIHIIIKFYANMIEKKDLNTKQYLPFSNEELKFFDMLDYETSASHYAHTKQEVEDWIYDL